MVRPLFGLEDELLTAPCSPKGPAARGDPIARFLRTAAGLSPSLPCQQGFFHTGGKIYLDYGGHVELATIECDDPFVLVHVLELQHLLLQRAGERMRDPGLFLANNNYSGLLTASAPTFGTHENYLVEGSPRRLSAAMLPFLATRVYQGAGGVHYPSGDFLLSVRALFLQTDVGGDTTECRALYSTCRQESLMGRSTGLYRLHLICADGHRSQFNTALLMGVTSLVLQAVRQDDTVVNQVSALRVRRGRESWNAVMRRVNVLQSSPEEALVDPIVARVQRVYLDHVRVWMQTQDDLPAWAEPIVDAWETCIEAIETSDLNWLAQRLDAFTKYQLVQNCLTTRGSTWTDLPNDAELFQRLTLLDHSYHAICDPESAFNQLDRSGVLRQRIVEPPEPGDELRGVIPDVGTRARVRAEFIRDHSGEKDLLIDWAWIQDSKRARRRYLGHPFAQEFGDWVNLRPPEPPPDLLRRLTEMRRRRRAAQAEMEDLTGETPSEGTPPGESPGEGSDPPPDPSSPGDFDIDPSDPEPF